MELREALASALEAGRPPSFYLDTNVIRNLMKTRRGSPDSVALFDLLKERRWPCVTSHFTYMELFDIEQEASYFRAKLDQGLEVDDIWRSRRSRDLHQGALRKIELGIDELIQGKLGIIERLYLDEAGWNHARDLASTSNVTASDCLHLATALIATCDVLVTSDSHLSRNAKRYVASGPPEQALREIRLLSRQ